MKKINRAKKFSSICLILRRIKITPGITFLIIGFASSVWFLVRVIPKPSRASYPCMRAAAPFMSAFILYLLTLTGSALLLRHVRDFIKKNRFFLAFFVSMISMALFLISSNLFPEKLSASGTRLLAEDYPPNTPYGDGIGNFPGRVVWSWDPNATDEKCTNILNHPERGEDGYFLKKNNNPEVIGDMLESSVLKLTGATSVKNAWDSLFIDLNRRKGLGQVTFQAGQKIFIKINQGGAAWLTKEGPDDDLSLIEQSWAENYYGMAESAPWLIIEVLNQLVNNCGIDQNNIYVGDPIAHIYKYHYDMMYNAFPEVHYVDYDENHADLGRTILTESSEPCLYYSDGGSVMPGALSDKLFAEMENADYLINLAALKAHSLAGISLSAKNHFGSHTREDASHLHPGLVALADDNPTRTEYGMYRVLTDIMGHEKLGRNTVIFLVDGLWGGPQATEKPVKWSMHPFNGDWPNSIFISQDQVALESVCFDFLRSEFSDPDGAGKARPWMGGVDDYLHQAADDQFWPDGISYDPENDGVPIGSLGVHEHWNNEVEKQYSRNLNSGNGIELLEANEIENHAVEVLGTIPDFEISELNVELIIHSKLAELFLDPDGDTLSYTINYNDSLLLFQILDGVLFVQAETGYEGITEVELISSDGEFQASIKFTVYRDITETGENLQLDVGILCYPNPFTDVFYLKVEEGFSYSGTAELDIYNLSGQLSASKDIILLAGQASVSPIVFEHGIPGLYILELKFNGKTYSKLIRKH